MFFTVSTGWAVLTARAPNARLLTFKLITAAANQPPRRPWWQGRIIAEVRGGVTGHDPLVTTAAVGLGAATVVGGASRI